MERSHVISADTHIVEPPDLYSSRIEPRFRDRIPQMKRRVTADGNQFDAWFLDNTQIGSVAQFAQAGRRFVDASQLDYIGVWEDIRLAAYNPHEMIKELAIDNVWGATLQPSAGLTWYCIADNTGLLSAICRAYNHWIADFCKPYPKRLRGIGCINVDNVEEACSDLEECTTLGLAGAFIPTYPLPNHRYNQRQYDRLWHTAQSLHMPLLMHVGAVRSGIPGCEKTIRTMDMTPAGRVTLDHWVRCSLSDMMFAGVFDRYPDLHIGSVEHEMAWIPHWLKTMDFVYKERQVFTKGWTSKSGFLPSDFWHQNLFAEFMEDDIGLRLRDLIGINNILWGNDFPHAESTWPNSMKFLDSVFADSDEAEREKITSLNASALFNFIT